ncbi:SDR family NAD(P)-dependent oxidoreductase [Nitratireductor sp. GCM10026969]|uniref:SDR family NAD(P)-dependent oxidoreductase n=1 Tax=Nitratireductor sp. GCM10026969 TaxID=3252645 RepID=UPI003607F887
MDTTRPHLADRLSDVMVHRHPAFFGERRHAVLGAHGDKVHRQGLSAQSVRLDLNDPASIAAAAKEIGDALGKLDILVNNAGIFDFADATPSKASIVAVRRVMETNFIGALAVTQAMLPLLRAAPAARIVNLSNSLGSLKLNGDSTSTHYSQQYIGYNASKAALNMLTIQLNEELRETGITVNSVSPGFVKTDLTGYGMMTPEQGARLPVQYALGGDGSGRFVEPDGEAPW